MKTRWAFRLARFVIAGLMIALVSGAAWALQTDYNGIDVIFVVDQSGSMSGAYNQVPTDPDMLRFQAQQHIVDWLGDFAHYAEPGATIRMSAIYFGDPQRTLMQDWVQLSPPGSSDQAWDIQSTDLRRLLSPAQFGFPPRNFGFTNFEGAMELARQQFDNLAPPPGNQRNLRVVVVITDGAPCTQNDLDSNNNCNNPAGQRGQLDRVYQLVQQAFSAPEYRLFVLALDNVADSRSYWDTYRSQWEQIVGDPARSRLITNINEMIKAVNDYVNQIRPLVSTSQITSPVSIDAQGKGTINMPPYVRRARFNVFKLATTGTPFDMTITLPDGNQVTRTSPQTDVSSDLSNVEVWAFNLPMPGIWTLHANTPGADIQVDLDQVFFKSELIDLAAAPRYQWQNIPLAPFLYYLENGSTQLPVTLDANYPITLTALLTSPSGAQAQMTLPVNSDPPGANKWPQFRGAYTPTEVGDYTIELVGQVPNVPDPLSSGGVFTPLDTRTANDRVTLYVNPAAVTLEFPDPTFIQNNNSWYITNPLPLCVIVKDRVSGARISDLDALQFEAVLQQPDGSLNTAPLSYQADITQHCTFTGSITPNLVGQQPLILRGYLPDGQGGQQKVYENQESVVNALPVNYIRLLIQEPAAANTSSPSISTMPFFGRQPLRLAVEALDQQGQRVDLRAAVGGAASPDPNPVTLRIEQAQGGQLVDVTNTNTLSTVDGTTFTLDSLDYDTGSYHVVIEGKPLKLAECACVYEPANAAGGEGRRAERTLERYFPFEVLLWPVGLLAALGIVGFLGYRAYRWGQDRTQNAMRGLLYFTPTNTTEPSEATAGNPVLINLDTFRLNRIELNRRKLRQLGLPFTSLIITNHGSARNLQNNTIFLTVTYNNRAKDSNFLVTGGTGQYELPGSRQPDGTYYTVEKDAEDSDYDDYTTSSDTMV